MIIDSIILYISIREYASTPLNPHFEMANQKPKLLDISTKTHISSFKAVFELKEDTKHALNPL